MLDFPWRTVSFREGISGSSDRWYGFKKGLPNEVKDYNYLVYFCVFFQWIILVLVIILLTYSDSSISGTISHLLVIVRTGEIPHVGVIPEAHLSPSSFPSAWIEGYT